MTFFRSIHLWSPLLLLPVLAISAGLARGADEKTNTAAQQATYEKEIKPLVQQFCLGCHGDKKALAGINLATFADVASVQRDQTTWRKVLSQVRERHMPPSNLPQPKQEQRDHFVAWLANALDTADPNLLPKNPGRVLIHRLTRLEYNNTVRDLFGITSSPADNFPADGGGGGGFDNNSDTLYIPPILMERLLVAATDILDEAKPTRIFLARPDKQTTKRAAAKKILSHFAMRAYRRPVTLDDIARLLGLYDRAVKRNETHENAVKFALKAVLVSPNFLFRVEKDRPGSEPYPIDDYELASRLSYFLWASMPDDTLFQLAAQKKLRKPGVLEAQVQRMLKSPKAQAMADSFAGQWLRVRELTTSAQPDPSRFPNFTPTLRDAMIQETVHFFLSVLRDDSNLLELIDTDYTYLNEELAKHYGIEGVTGGAMRRVALSDRRRGGIVTMASVLTQTSYPLRTSPVLRGKWILSEMLGSPPPPPPPVVATLSQDDKPKDGLTFRQRLEEHRKKPECASCHNRMDPLGFGLENFDAVGKWRDEIGEQKVDASGVLASGEKFVGPVELKKTLLHRKEEFVRNLTERMLSYALGRGLEPYDLPAVQKITRAVTKENYRSSVLLREIVTSYPFQYRKNQ